ncbi:MAG: DEAD/DEAH box helicase family protein [Candidatus Aenigmarchaeota archaeon]|nr:DEAD/DEAH box helicase family protein [Candidatus Aenigmarchaeota archaeon]
MTIARPEDKARHDIINPALKAAGWEIQHYKTANPRSSKGVVIEFFQMGKDVGEADYVLFVNGVAVGILEAKKEGETLTGKEFQSKKYATGFPEDFRCIDTPLPFVYESSGNEIRFTNLWDIKPRSRELFAFHKPETLETWVKQGRETLRSRLSKKYPMENKRLWPVQKEAVVNTEKSLSWAKPRALIQMATGSGKTYTAVELCYRLVKNVRAKRILFLVDRRNLGEQTLQEFQNYEAPNDRRKFTELYPVQHLSTNKIDDSSKICIATIQRVYSMLKGEKDFDTENEEKTSFDDSYPTEPVSVAYNRRIPIETFDFIIVDECHRSIYNLWRQVLEYFDAFTIGLTATPSKTTIGFFNNNLVMEYGHEQAVADQINVDFSVYDIRTKITKQGSRIPKGETVLKRDMRTRKKRWESLEDDVVYTKEQLDRAVVARDQIRTIIRTFRDKVKTEIFPGRKHVPKTLIYAKDDNHADEIVQIIREEFNEGNDFAIKITYKTEGQKPEDLIRQFRNEFNPRIAVTVDMIATGTDIKPLEIVFFMRQVKSRNYFEQMKGRAVRVMKNDDFMTVTPDATAKERFVIVDAVGVCDNENLNETTPLEQYPGMSFSKLVKILQYGKPKKEHMSSMASRLSRLQKKLTETQINEITSLTGGKALTDFARAFVDSIDEDKIYEAAQQQFGKEGEKDAYTPLKRELDEVTGKRILDSLKPFIGNAKLMSRLPEIKKEVEQIIDTVSLDVVEEAAYSPIATEKAKEIVTSFRSFIQNNRKELTAIQIFHNKGKLHWKDLRELSDKIRTHPYFLTESKLWQAYQQLEHKKVKGASTNKIADFISLLSFELKKTPELEPYLDTVDKRFAEWLGRQKEAGVEFTQEQLTWLKKLKDHISTSIEVLPEDLEDPPFNQMGGLGKASKVFKNLNDTLEDLNEEVGGV